MTTTTKKPAATAPADALREMFSKHNVAELNRQSLLFENSDTILYYYIASLSGDANFKKENAFLTKSTFYQAPSVVRQIGPYPFMMFLIKLT